MDREKYISVDTLENIIQAIPESTNTDTVTIEIKRLSDSYTWNFTDLEFQSGSYSDNMTFVSGNIWKQSFTPPTADTYIVTINNSTLDVKYYIIYHAVGTAPTTPSAPSGSDLTTYANVKEYLGLTDDNDEDFIGNLITRASDFIAKYCRRIFEAADYTEYHDGTSNKSICLKQYPVNSITSLHDDLNREYGADYLIASTDYVIDEDAGILTLDGYRFGVGLKNIKVVYNAGYETIPANLEQACIELVSMKFNTKETDGIKSEKIGSYSVSYSEAEIPATIKATLTKYIKRGIH